MKFSIITCTYNSEDYLQNNIDSVKNQKFVDFEHVFIDGYSTDGTIEIIKKYQSASPDKVKLFQFNPMGIANAMNKGIEKSAGDYLIHLHSDDSFYDNNILSNVDKFIERTKFPAMIYGKAKFISDDGSFRIIPHRKIYHKLRFWLLLLTNYIPHQAVFLRRNTFERFGMFDEIYKNSMDYELWVRLSKNKIHALFLDEIICNFSMRANAQSSMGAKNCLEENISIQEKYIKSKLLLIPLVILTKINSRRKLI